jgi:predicted dehydrogenase
VAAETATLSHRIETEDTASASIRFANGALGIIQGTTSASEDWPARIEVVGTGGRAVLEAGRLTVSEPDIASDSSLLSDHDLAITAAEPAESSFVGGHQRQLREIFAALRAGEQPPVSGAEGRKALEIILGIYESAKTGQRVLLSTK